MAKDESEKLLEQIKNILERSRREKKTCRRKEDGFRRVENLQNHTGLEALSPLRSSVPTTTTTRSQFCTKNFKGNVAADGTLKTRVDGSV